MGAGRRGKAHHRDAPPGLQGTSVGATHLISLYERKGFEIVGEADFKDTNYKSVIMVKSL